MLELDLKVTFSVCTVYLMASLLIIDGVNVMYLFACLLVRTALCVVNSLLLFLFTGMLYTAVLKLIKA